MTSHEFIIPALTLESGTVLQDVIVHYRVSGDVQSQPVVWVFHALTANDNPFEWWPGLFGQNKLYGDDFAVVCVNVPGSPYGSSSPIKGNAKGMAFPLFTVRDTVRTQLEIARHLGISHIHTLIGGSFGGYQALEFAFQFDGVCDFMVLIATGAEEKPWGKAIHETQRLALEADPTLHEGGGQAGLRAARGIGMLQYRTYMQYNATQKDREEEIGQFRAPSYIRYQGQKLVDRFDAICYYKLTQQLDTHHIGRGRGGLAKALSQIGISTLVLSISSDTLIPPSVQEELASYLPKSILRVIQSTVGHDGFLLEYEQIQQLITSFYNDHHNSTDHRTVSK